MNARSLLIALLLAVGLPGASQGKVIKHATLVPAGSTWDRALQDMAKQWEQGTEGRVKVRFYPGGVAGDDPDVVRKMRIGQLQAATLTVTGLAEIHESFSVFTIPMLFEGYEELFEVLDGLEPVLRQGLRDKGFELLHWVPGGWVRFFSRQPVQTVEELQQLKIFTWAGDEEMVRAWQQNGFRPVALAYTDIPMGLESGLIEALPTTPLAALSLQWFRRTPFVLDLGVAPLIGATVMRRDAWDQIAPGDREILLREAAAAEDRMRREIPSQDDAALQEMKDRGLTLSAPLNDPDWRATAESFAAAMRGRSVPIAIYDQVLEKLRELRKEP